MIPITDIKWNSVDEEFFDGRLESNSTTRRLLKAKFVGCGGGGGDYDGFIDN